MRSLAALLLYIVLMLTCLSAALLNSEASELSKKCREFVGKADNVIKECSDVVVIQETIIDTQKEIIDHQDGVIETQSQEIKDRDNPDTKWFFGLGGSTLTLLLILIL